MLPVIFPITFSVKISTPSLPFLFLPIFLFTDFKHFHIKLTLVQLCFIQQNKTVPKAALFLYLSTEFSFDFLHGCCMPQTLINKCTASFHFCALHLRQYSILSNVIQFLLVVPPAFQYLKNLLIVLDDSKFCCIYLAQLPHLFEMVYPTWNTIFYSSLIRCDKVCSHVWLNSVLLFIFAAQSCLMYNLSCSLCFATSSEVHCNIGNHSCSQLLSFHL